MHSTTPQSKKTFQALWRLEKIILESLNFTDVVQKIVDSTVLELGYLELGYEIVVLCLVNKETQTLERISVSQTQRAKEALAQLQSLGTPFRSITIPLTEKKNLLIQALEQDKQFVTQNWHDILSPVFNEEESKTIQSKLGIKNSLIFPIRSKNTPIGVIIFSMSKDTSLMEPDEMDLMGNFSDIVGLAVQNASIHTKLAETKVQLEHANEELKALDKLKDEFLSMASHELKSPMNAVKNYLWMALQKGLNGDPVKLKGYLTIAYEQINRLTALVNDLLDVSRIESGRIVLDIIPLDLAKAVNETIQIYTSQAAQKGIALTASIDPALRVSADDIKLREILANLVSNAVKYTPAGSVTVSAQEKESMLRLSVTDTGLGITPEDQQKLFQKFSRVNESYKSLATIEGTGLGLYISKKFVEMMGGTIGLDSAPGKGSTFWVELPKTD